MPWVDIIWTDYNEAHVAEHGISCDDADQVIRNPIDDQTSDSSGRPIAFGYIADGRKIGVVYERIDNITLYPITAFEVK